MNTVNPLFIVNGRVASAIHVTEKTTLELQQQQQQQQYNNNNNNNGNNYNGGGGISMNYNSESSRVIVINQTSY